MDGTQIRQDSYVELSAEIAKRNLGVGGSFSRGVAREGPVSDVWYITNMDWLTDPETTNEYLFGAYAGNSVLGVSSGGSDVTFSLGAGLYIGSGAEVSVGFNFTRFWDLMGWR